MSVSTEIEWLEGIDTGSTPPCDCEVQTDGGAYTVCGLPSVAHMKRACTACGDSVTGFICKRCLEFLLGGAAECPACGNLASSNDWRFI